ncbi:MAG TPA: glycosyltransferase, partial [bacterium]|nr:glycosyltransferase [bacterium]
KKELIRQFGLSPECLSRPLIGIVTRLAYQKGIDLLVEALPDLLKSDVALTILGTGELNLEEALSRLGNEYSGSCGVRIAYDERMAHLIEAGADMFLMPSRYEPCGLSQLYSLKYGTIPIVRSTGGLADTIRDADEDPEGNGFVFEESSAAALKDTVDRAIVAFRTAQRWNEIVRRAMAQDFSWSTAARAYEKLYRKILREAGV